LLVWLFLICIGFSKLRYILKAGSLKSIPGPSPLPIIGNALPLLFTGAHSFVKDLANKYGDVFVIWLGARPFVVVNEEELIKDVLQTKNAQFRKGSFADIMRPLLGVGLLTSEGETWKVHHKIALSSFQPSRYKNTVEQMGKLILLLLDKWERKFLDSTKPFEICNEMSRLTLDNVGVAAFGGQFNAIESEETCIYDAVAYSLREMQKRAEQLYPIFQYYPSFWTRSFEESNNKIKDIVREKIQERRQSNNKETTYLLDAMLEAQEFYQLSEDEILDEMVTFVMGGHETTSSLLSWAFYVIDNHPIVQERLMQELDSCVPRGSIPTFDDLQKMDYLLMVLKETLRLYPPAPLLNRTSLTEVEIGGFTIPANTEILICPWAIQRSHKYWDKPDEFIPERWKDDTRASSFTFVPFSAGPRACLGKMFAFMEAKLVVCMILQRYQVNFVKNQNVETEVAITLRAKYGLLCNLVNRK